MYQAASSTMLLVTCVRFGNNLFCAIHNSNSGYVGYKPIYRDSMSRHIMYLHVFLSTCYSISHRPKKASPLTLELRQ